MTLYYSLGGTDHIKKAAAAALTWAAGGRTAEVCGISFMMMEYARAHRLAFILWRRKKVSESKLVPLRAQRRCFARRRALLPRALPGTFRASGVAGRVV